MTDWSKNKLVKLSQDGHLLQIQTIHHASSENDYFDKLNYVSVSPEGLI